MSNDFSVYRCPDPLKVQTDGPWYPISNVCPCNPDLSDPTGRGTVPCPFGIQTDQKKVSYASMGLPMAPKGGAPKGSLYSMNQFSPPQKDPRPNTRIENQWRNAF